MTASPPRGPEAAAPPPGGGQLLDHLCAGVLRRYLGQTEDMPPDFTRGLFYRGVE